jgi:aminomethyltransferase
MSDSFQYFFLESTDSTNTYLKEHPEYWTPYTTIHAKVQTSGRGRHGRTWYTANSSLTFSFAYVIEGSVNPAAITLYAGLALRKAISDLTHEHINVKWPNDILYSGKKVGGILTELVQKNGKKVIITGIGLNISTADLPPEIQKNAQGLSELLIQPPVLKGIIDAVIKEMKNYLPLYSFPLPEKILNEYNKYCLLGRLLVSVQENCRTIKKLFNVHGIDKTGNLLVENNNEIKAIPDAFEICQQDYKMKKTPLYENHCNLNARIVDFAGYAMPVQYKGIKDEYLSVRNDCGLFDISHMCPIWIKSKDPVEVLNFINHVTCRNISKLKTGKIQYNAVPSETGGLLDDITVYKINDNEYIMLVNASNSEKIINHLNMVKSKEGSSVEINPFKDYVLLALQGKNSQNALEKTSLVETSKLTELFFYEFLILPGYDMPFFVSRTGYSGEDGFEILLPAEKGVEIWNQLMQNGVAPCGLGARDILRMEVFYPLYGHELQEDWTPLESSIDWIVSSDKEYIGKNKIVGAAPRFKICGFIMKEKGAMPRGHYPVLDNSGKKIGEVTSGGFSFIWDKGFGMAVLEPEYHSDGKKIFIDIRGKSNEAEVILKSPYNGSIKRRQKK